jgi:replicative DNA helicase
MANVELELLSNIVETGDFQAVRHRGFTPDILQTEEARVVFQWIWDEFHDQGHPGEIPDHARLMRRFPDFYFCPSRNSVDALVTDIVQSKIRAEMLQITIDVQAYLDQGEDPNMVLGYFLPKMRDLNATGAGDDGILISQSVALLRQEYNTRQNAGGVTGIPYPWQPLNMATGGMNPEEFIVVYGRVKNGKSWLATLLAAHAYNNNKRVLVYSREMSREVMLRRTSSIVCGVDYELLRQGNLGKVQEEAFFDILTGLVELEEDTRSGTRRRALMFVGDKGKKTASTVDSLTAIAEKFEPDLVLVDGFYLMRDSRTNVRSTDWKQITHISQDLKGMAQYLKIPLVGTTQANRAAKDTPGDDLSELSYADAIGQDADIGIRCFLGRGPGSQTAMALTFPGVREGKLNPFLINFNPGTDFSLMQTSVDMAAFLADKKRTDKEAEFEKKGAGEVGDGPAGEAKQRKPVKAAKNPFRQ